MGRGNGDILLGDINGDKIENLLRLEVPQPDGLALYKGVHFIRLNLRLAKKVEVIDLTIGISRHFRQIR